MDAAQTRYKVSDFLRDRMPYRDPPFNPQPENAVAFLHCGIPKIKELLLHESNREKPDNKVELLDNLLTLVSAEYNKSRAISEHGIVEVMTALLDDADARVREYALQVLASLATINSGKLAIQKQRSLDKITKMLTDKLPRIRAQAAKVVFHIASSFEGCTILCREGVVAPLVQSLDIDSSEHSQTTVAAPSSHVISALYATPSILEMKVGALNQLTREDDALLQALDAGMLTKVLNIYKNNLERAAKDVEEALHRRTDPSLAEVVRYVQPGKQLQLEALRCLCNAAKHGRGKRNMVDLGLVPELAKLISIRDDDLKREIVSTIMLLVVDVEAKVAALNAGIIETLCHDALGHKDEHIREDAKLALKLIAEFPKAREAIKSVLREQYDMVMEG